MHTYIVVTIMLNGVRCTCAYVIFIIQNNKSRGDAHWEFQLQNEQQWLLLAHRRNSEVIRSLMSHL